MHQDLAVGESARPAPAASSLRHSVSSTTPSFHPASYLHPALSVVFLSLGGEAGEGSISNSQNHQFCSAFLKGRSCSVPYGKDELWVVTTCVLTLGLPAGTAHPAALSESGSHMEFLHGKVTSFSSSQEKVAAGC